ncbi:hypothetical protein NW762_012604 [Fusarium torreyae]|uniref:Secreted protein n=1 Tax=Fusarium torreyae TaxID=1237075 RepID=A0A9W8RPW1_9HYPO|nr:hypothetical protein NW762_012604 [Fusarium torreyae]
MYFGAILVVSSAAFVSANCFTNGDNWGGDRSAALAAAQTLCNDGTLNGDYTKAEVKYKCVNLSTIKKVDFTITADYLIFADAHITLGSEDCVRDLHTQINACEHGGVSPWYEFDEPTGDKNLIGNLQFTADPNTGNCA